MTSAAITRLAELQRQFGQALRTPLDRSTGTLRATPALYDPALQGAVVGDAAERLAVYNRQYWFRLFGVVQQAYRLATALLGAWELNDLAARFLLAHPPSGHDLGRAIDGFAAFVAAEVPATGSSLGSAGWLPREALVEALRIDDAFRAVFEAPDLPALQLTPADAARLPRSRLVASPAFAMVDETWPLVALRRGLPAALPERPVPLPAPHAGGPQTWAICRGADGQRTLPLPPAHAELLRLVRVHPLPDALSRLEAQVPPEAAHELAAAAQTWFADGLRFGFWTDLAPAT